MPGSRTDNDGREAVVVPGADYLWFVDQALAGMCRILEELGDDLANEHPPLRGANSPYAILTHCLGVMEYWGGSTLAERTVQRDRASEFTAHGDVAPLLEQVATARRRLEQDMEGIDAMAAPARPRPDDPVPYDERKGAVLLHVIEELYQHFGQMEITRDLLLAHHERKR